MIRRVANLQVILTLEPFVADGAQVLSLIRVRQTVLGQSADIVELFPTNRTLNAAFARRSHVALTLGLRLLLWLLLLLLLLLLLQWLLDFLASVAAAFVGWLHFIHSSICVKHHMKLINHDISSRLNETKVRGV